MNQERPNDRKPNRASRRKFLQQLGGASLLLSVGAIPSLAAEKKIGPNDTLRIACIGMGIMGFNDVHTALQVPGIQLVAAADLYTGRLQHAKELYGKDLFTSRDYHEILGRKDIDAVIIATS